MRVVSQIDPSKCREVPGSDPTPALASATGPEVTIASRPDYGPVADPKPRQLCLAYFRGDKTVARYAAADGQCIVWRWLDVVPC